MWWYRAAPSTTTPYCGALRRSPAATPSGRTLPGIMGAFGAALIARERYDLHPKETSMLSLDQIIGLTYTTTMTPVQAAASTTVS